MTLSSSVTAGVGYGDNVKMSSNKALGDAFSTEQVALYLEALQKRRTFSLTYEGLDQQYTSYPNLDRVFEDHYVGLRDFESLSRRTYLQVDDSFLTGNAQAGVVVGAGELPLNSELIYSELFPARSAQNRFDLHLAGDFDEDTTVSLSMHQYVFSGGGSVTADQGVSAEAFRRIVGPLSGGIGYQYKYVMGLSGPLSESPDSSYHWPQAQLRYGGLGPILIQAGAGPIVQQSSSGLIGDTPRPSQSKIDLGYQLSASYSNKALEIEASGGQSPGQTAGLAVGSLNRGGYVVLNYRGWRNLGAFSQVGYLDFLDGGTDAQYLECAGGISYRLRHDLSVTVQYIFLKSSSSPGGDTAHSLQERNYLFLSVAYALPALRWSF